MSGSHQRDIDAHIASPSVDVVGRNCPQSLDDKLREAAELVDMVVLRTDLREGASSCQLGQDCWRGPN